MYLSFFVTKLTPESTFTFYFTLVAVGNNIVDMVFEIGGGICMDGAVMQCLANVWHDRRSNFPLYVCHITRSQVGANAQFVSSELLLKLY